MKKIVILGAFICAIVSIKAQYGTINAVLDRLEERHGINQHLENVSIEDKKFVIIKNFDDHTERNIIAIKGNTATYVEIFDDLKTGQSSTNVFSGDIVRTPDNVVSARFDKLEGQKISVPVTKTFVMARQKDIIYLIDANNNERWIDEKSFGKDKKNKRR